MKQNIFLNSVLNRGAIVGFVMLCSHIFEQCAVVYGGSMTWYSIMGFEMVVSCALFVWMIHRFTKSYSLEVMDARQELKMFSFGQGFSMQYQYLCLRELLSAWVAISCIA